MPTHPLIFKNLQEVVAFYMASETTPSARLQLSQIQQEHIRRLYRAHFLKLIEHWQKPKRPQGIARPTSKPIDTDCLPDVKP